MVSGQRPSVAAGGVTLSRLLSNTSDSSVPVDTRTIRRTASPNGAPAAGCRYISTRCGFLARASDAHLMRCIALAAWQSPVWTYLTVIDQSWAIFRSLPPPVCFHCLSGICGSIHAPLCQLLLSCTHYNEQVCRYILCLYWKHTCGLNIKLCSSYFRYVWMCVCSSFFWDTCFLHIFIFLSACLLYFHCHLISK